MIQVTQAFGECPCQMLVCEAVGTKLTKYGHLVGCNCAPCRGRRSKRSGQRKQSAVLKDAARAEGRTMEIAPTHEEQARLLVHYESKSGAQVWRALGGLKGAATIKSHEKQARDFADRQTPRRKWAVVYSFPGSSERRIWMDYDQWLLLVAELMEVS